jgi:chromosome segregation ATPase
VAHERACGAFDIAQKAHDGLVAELTAKQRQFDQESGDLATLKQEIEELQRANAKRKQEKAELGTLLARYENDAQQKVAYVQSLQGQLQIGANEAMSTEDTLKPLLQRANALAQALHTHQAELETRTAKRQALQRDQQTLVQRRAHAQRTGADAATCKAKLKESITKLDKALEGLDAGELDSPVQKLLAEDAELRRRHQETSELVLALQTRSRLDIAVKRR